MKNIFQGKGKKERKGEIQTKIEVKQRLGDTDIDNIIDKNEAKVKKKDEESELEKIKF